jgi:hypothetical protein
MFRVPINNVILGDYLPGNAVKSMVTKAFASFAAIFHSRPLNFAQTQPTDNNLANLKHGNVTIDL